MKISLGETFEEKQARLSEWHRWFAWHPVHLTGRDWRWLEYVMRRGDLVAHWADVGWEWEYRSMGIHCDVEYPAAEETIDS